MKTVPGLTNFVRTSAAAALTAGLAACSGGGSGETATATSQTASTTPTSTSSGNTSNTTATHKRVKHLDRHHGIEHISFTVSAPDHDQTGS